MSSLNCRFVALVAFTVAAPGILADTVVLQPGADTTLIQAATDANLGGANFFNAGTTATGNKNRALMWFDVATQIPVGALIESVTLTLDIVRQPSGDWQAAVFGLHRVNVSWGEGNKIPEDGSPGLGALATAGEATWVNRFVGGELWAVPGGQAGVDFAEQPSSAALVFGMGDPVMFEGTVEMIADVQAWVDNPNNNFGWMLMTETEEVRKSARSFASREDGSGGPMLTIQFTVVPEPGTVALLGAMFILAWVCRRCKTAHH